jgi:hypothetical protein
MHSVISTAIKIDFTVGKTFRFFMNEITKRFFLFQISFLSLEIFLAALASLLSFDDPV